MVQLSSSHKPKSITQLPLHRASQPLFDYYSERHSDRLWRYQGIVNPSFPPWSLIPLANPLCWKKKYICHLGNIKSHSWKLDIQYSSVTKGLAKKINKKREKERSSLGKAATILRSNQLPHLDENIYLNDMDIFFWANSSTDVVQPYSVPHTHIQRETV